nr:alpha/beta hydrolase fold domain-containing protein [Solirubrobacterales bacterium]
VVYPTYQRAPFFDVETPLHNAVAGIRAAFEALGAGIGPVVVAGHSAGGALAADVAAVARRSELPTPAAIYAVYPGRGLRGIPLRLATPDATGIDPRTRVLALAGAGDTVVGAEPARLIVATAPVPDGRRELRLVTDPAVADHQAPHRFGPPEQATFWRPLDHLLRRAVAGA